MDLIRRYFTTIKLQLGGLTVSQKLLIGLLAVVMIATIFFTVIFSAKPAMVPLIAQPMSAEEINRAEMVLKSEKYDYVVATDKIMVPVEQAYAIRGDLASQQALPKDLTTAFRIVAMDNNPFQTQDMKERQWNNALQEELTKYLRSFPYVEDGSVIIAHGERAGLGTPMMPSTATVNVKVKGGDPLSANQLMAIVEMVSGAVSGMKRDAVHVVDGQRAYHAPSSDSPIPADLLEFKKTLEDEYTRKLYTMFEHYGDVKIAVNIVPDLSQRVREVQTFDPKNTVVKPLTETNHDTNSTEGSSTEGQPGVPPNTQMSVADSSGGGGRKQSSTSNDTSTTNVVNVGSTTEKVTLPPGVEFKELTASLTLPRSYFVSAFRRIKGDPKLDPKDEDLQPVVDSEIKKAQKLAKNTIGAKSDDQVQVDWFDDEIVTRGMEMPKGSGALAAAGLPGVVAQYAKQGVLAIVALGTLGMMLMMVKRAVPGGDDAGVDGGVFFGGKGGKGKRKQGELDQLDNGDDIYGEANEGDAVLTGIELDDETLQSRKMVDEVSIMIKENPENAATLVKRWMAKSK